MNTPANVLKDPKRDDFSRTITDVYLECQTYGGRWAIMTPQSWLEHANKTLHAFVYIRNNEGYWLRVRSIP